MQPEPFEQPVGAVEADGIAITGAAASPVPESSTARRRRRCGYRDRDGPQTNDQVQPPDFDLLTVQRRQALPPGRSRPTCWKKTCASTPLARSVTALKNAQ